MTSPAAFEAPDPEDLSKVIPGFTIGHLLATGPDSAVYSAIQTSLERQVALRVYSPTASNDPKRVRGVETTTRAMARLKHRNLIGLFDSGTREGMMYVVMEYVAGKPLARSLTGGPVHHAQVRSIIAGVCEGLAHAHQNKIAHGKLNEHAILLNPDAEPKIGGFQGGDFEKNKEDDIIAVGRLLYLMLTGVEESPRSVEPSVLAGSPPDLDEIWLRCTDRGRKDAFEAVQEIVEALTKPRKMTAHAASAAPVPGGAPKPPATVTVSSGSQWVLVRNLVLIVVLIIAIIKVWGMTQRKEREMQQKQQEARQQAARQQEQRYQEALAKKQANQGQKRPTKVPNSSSGNSSTVPEPAPEIREAPIAEIREALASGKRDVLPTGSVRRGGSAYLLVRDLLSWPEACWFAERHGGHLAVPDQSADLSWLQSIADGEPYWLGAGRGARSGGNAWLLVDGNSWEPPKEPAGLGKYLAADKFGFLRAAGDQVRLPCIVQWRMDGSNPARLESLLSRAQETLNSQDAVYPPGTEFLGDRAYLLVSRDLNWEGARRLAELAGGKLAAASDAAELLHLQEMALTLTAGKPYWMGARRTEKGWFWASGDEWRNIPIRGDSAKAGSALAVSSDGGWLALDARGEAAGFVIEWTGPGSSSGHAGGNTGDNTGGKTPSNPDAPNGGSAVASSISSLDAQAKRLVQTAWDKREKELKDNVSRMQSLLDSSFRNMNRTLQRDWADSLAEFKGLIENNRVPADVGGTGIQLNEDMTKIAANAATKQKSIDAEFTASTSQVREAYQKRLRDIMTKALESNERQTVLDLKPKLDASEQLDTWLELLGFSSKD